jgi:serpin B
VFTQNDRSQSVSAVGPLVTGNTEFALALYQALRTKPGNLFFSPYSISTALAMTYAGARGTTALEMAHALRFRLPPEALHPAFSQLNARLSDIGQKGHVRLKVANALWPHLAYPFLKPFLALTRHYYDTQITPVDYGDAEAARGIINAWVEEKTEQKIKNLIPEGVLNALTRLVLVNAIYFKGIWASQFDRNRTDDAPFWVSPHGQVQAPLMQQQTEFRYGEVDGLQILELPYVGEDLSMILLLPAEIDGLAALEARLTSSNLAKWTQKLWAREVQVFLPRFKMTYSVSLSETLQAMGMVDAFGPADFSGMTGDRCLFISAILHKAFIEVNEEGTEAAAATAVIISKSMPPPPPPIFRADHPFVVLIRENRTGSLLFLGRVTNPAVKGD